MKGRGELREVGEKGGKKRGKLRRRERR